jgi:hypothetical protein
MAETFPMKLMIDGIGEALSKNGLLAQLCGARIYHQQAPPGTFLNFVEYRRTDGGPVNVSPRGEVRTTWEVYGVSTDEDKALKMAEAIHAIMVNNGIVMIGWDNYRHTAVDWSYRKFWIDANEYFAIGEFYDLDAARRGKQT